MKNLHCFDIYSLITAHLVVDGDTAYESEQTQLNKESQKNPLRPTSWCSRIWESEDLELGYTRLKKESLRFS